MMPSILWGKKSRKMWKIALNDCYSCNFILNGKFGRRIMRIESLSFKNSGERRTAHRSKSTIRVFMCMWSPIPVYMCTHIVVNDQWKRRSIQLHHLMRTTSYVWLCLDRNPYPNPSLSEIYKDRVQRPFLHHKELYLLHDTESVFEYLVLINHT